MAKKDKVDQAVILTAMILLMGGIAFYFAFQSYTANNIIKNGEYLDCSEYYGGSYLDNGIIIICSKTEGKMRDFRSVVSTLRHEYTHVYYDYGEHDEQFWKYYNEVEKFDLLQC